MKSTLPMPHRRSHPFAHVHFATGPVGTLQWMTYWLTSRLTNGSRAILLRWQEHQRPTLDEHLSALADRASALLRRSGGSTTKRPYQSLAEAVQQRGLADTHG